MKRVLYVSNIEVPYRAEFFNQLSNKVELTVLYERKKSSNRDETWASSVKSNYRIIYLNGIKLKKESSFDISIIKYIFSNQFDEIIIGCYNSPVQMFAILLMKLFRKKYILNIDGEYYFDGNSLKKKLKRFFIYGAYKYFVAGDYPQKNLTKYIDDSKVFVYHFSSLTREELYKHSLKINKNNNNSVLVIGQYYDYKGLDIAIEVAKKNDNIKYKFIGSGKRSNLLKKRIDMLNLSNVEVIPFLQKVDLYKEYNNCMCLILPSRCECWGLVINEAASFGCPIISTYGSGAGVEFLQDKYDSFLAYVDDADDLYNKLSILLNYDTINSYKQFLVNKSKKYSIEENVDSFCKMIES